MNKHIRSAGIEYFTTPKTATTADGGAGICIIIKAKQENETSQQTLGIPHG